MQTRNQIASCKQIWFCFYPDTVCGPHTGGGVSCKPLATSLANFGRLAAGVTTSSPLELPRFTEPAGGMAAWQSAWRFQRPAVFRFGMVSQDQKARGHWVCGKSCKFKISLQNLGCRSPTNEPVASWTAQGQQHSPATDTGKRSLLGVMLWNNTPRLFVEYPFLRHGIILVIYIYTLQGHPTM